ncbi:MAG: hypothetical protein ACRCX2_10205 [Paraclostridium sp.]
MNKQQRKIAKLSKIFFKLQTFNNPSLLGNYNTFYRKFKWAWKDTTDEEYRQTMDWCRQLLKDKENSNEQATEKDS